MKGEMGDRQRVVHILESISEIEKYTSGQAFDTFLENSMMRFATVKQIEIIGEAANLISNETKKRFDNIQWRQIIGLRHILVHEYFGIDVNLIWQIVVNDIPNLKQSIAKVLADL